MSIRFAMKVFKNNINAQDTIACLTGTFGNHSKLFTHPNIASSFDHTVSNTFFFVKGKNAEKVSNYV